MKKGFRRWRGSVEDPIIIACGSGEGEWGRADTQACATFYSTLFVVRQVGEARFKGFFLLFISTFSTFFSALFVVKKLSRCASKEFLLFYSTFSLLFLLSSPHCLSWNNWASHVSKKFLLLFSSTISTSYSELFVVRQVGEPCFSSWNHFEQAFPC